MRHYITSDINGIAAVLREQNITVPSGFFRTWHSFEKEHYNMYHKVLAITTFDVKLLIKMCKHWKPFLTEESFNTLVLCKLVTLYTIHCAAISSLPNTGSYLGNQSYLGKSVEVSAPLPPVTVTVLGLGRTYYSISSGKSAPLRKIH